MISYGNTFALMLIALWALLPSVVFGQTIITQTPDGPPGCYCEVDGEITYIETYNEEFCLSAQTQSVELAGTPVRGCIWYPDGIPGEDIIVEEFVPEAPLVGNIAQELSRLNQVRGVNGQTPQGAVSTISGRIIFFFLTVIGTVGLAMFIYAGLLFMFSQGNSEKEKKAFGIMVWTSIGLLAALGSYGIVRFIFNAYGV